MIRSKKLSLKKHDFKVGLASKVKVTETNTQLAIQINQTSFGGNNITKIDSDHYIVNKTGEIKTFNRTTKRIDCISSLAQSMKRLRDTINVNVVDTKKCSWLTLTYAENMQSEERLYEDFRRFIQRFRYYCDKQQYPHFEYINAIEYQGRGALHCHILLIWSEIAPYIPNDTIAKIWGLGFTKTKALNGAIENVGNYLTAYLTDLPLEEAFKAKIDMSKHNIKDIKGKKYVKASRLCLYPPNCKLYRCSKGIKKPKTYTTSWYELSQVLEANNAELAYENLILLYDNDKFNGFSNLIKYQYYDITPSAQQRVMMVKAYRVSKYYRTLYKEMLDIMAMYPNDELEYYSYELWYPEPSTDI